MGNDEKPNIDVLITEVAARRTTLRKTTQIAREASAARDRAEEALHAAERTLQVAIADRISILIPDENE